jgi:hypothetical protein
MIGKANFIVQSAALEHIGILKMAKRKPFTYKTIKKKDGSRDVTETSEFEVTKYYYDANGILRSVITVEE